MARSGSAYGERKRRLLRSLDYYFVSRFRLRRLLAFLWRNSYDEAFEALSKETTVFFRVDHLQLMVQQGLWSDAIRYVLRFVPAVALSKGGNFLVIFINLISSVSRYKPTDPSTFPQRLLDVNGRVKPGYGKVAEIIRSGCSQEAWGSINWALVRLKAAEIVGDLLTQLPEFDEMRRLPPCPALVKPANVLPVRASSRGHSRFHKSGRIPADALARSFLSKKRTDSSNQGTSQPGLPLEPFTKIRMAELIDECLQAGKSLVINDKHLVESSPTEGWFTLLTGSRVDEYSIKKCISVLSTIVELTGEEKAEAFDVFKDAQNREIFMNAEPRTRLIWMRKKWSLMV